MFIEDLSEENKEFLLKEIEKHYQKRIEDIEKLFIKIIKIDKHSIHRLEKLKQLENNQKAFLFIENNEVELFVL